MASLTETNIFAPENGWLKYDRFLLGWPIFRGELLVSGRVRSPKLTFSPPEHRVFSPKRKAFEKSSSPIPFSGATLWLFVSRVVWVVWVIRKKCLDTPNGDNCQGLQIDICRSTDLDIVIHLVFVAGEEIVVR